ncbi:hypothetical protein CPR19079_NPKGKJFF_01074 [Companilactobacillus paralimentarius]
MSDTQDSDKTLANVITLLGITPTDSEKERLILYYPCKASRCFISGPCG